jgi:ribose-phosphate pyrophosphokinase
MIIGGPSSQLLAGRVAAELDEELALCDFGAFPDGEAYARIISELPDEATVVQSTPTDRDIIYLLQLLDACGKRKISLVVPYFGYARQDKVFLPGEPFSARTIARALTSFLGTGRIFLINVHSSSLLTHFSCPAQNLDATPLLAEKVRKLSLEDPVLISPDKGAVAMARAASRILGAEYDYLEKTRVSGTEVRMAPKEIDVRGRDVVVFDDMIATGGTMATAIAMLRGLGARKVYLAAVHPVLTGSALLKLYRSGVEAMLATDTLDRGISAVSVAPLIAQALR